MHLERPIDEVHDPVLVQAGPRVDRRLEAAVEPQARVGDLDDERRRRGVGGDVVERRAGDDRDVGLGLRVLTERQWGSAGAGASPSPNAAARTCPIRVTTAA